MNHLCEIPHILAGNLIVFLEISKKSYGYTEIEDLMIRDLSLATNNATKDYHKQAYVPYVHEDELLILIDIV